MADRNAGHLTSLINTPMSKLLSQAKNEFWFNLFF